MDSPVKSPVTVLTVTAALPSWALPRGREPDDLGAAFAAGIALKSLDDLVRSQPAWAGSWRARQALSCAAVAVRLMGRSEEAPALCDAVLLTEVGGDPGPAGKVLLVFTKLATQKPFVSSKAVAKLVVQLGLTLDDVLAGFVVDLVDDAHQSGHPPSHRPTNDAAADAATVLDRRHRHYHFASPLAAGTHPFVGTKWMIAPQKAGSSQWQTHRVHGFAVQKPHTDIELRHFLPMSTGWKESRPPALQQPEYDAALTAAYQRVGWGETKD